MSNKEKEVEIIEKAYVLPPPPEEPKEEPPSEPPDDEDEKFIDAQLLEILS